MSNVFRFGILGEKKWNEVVSDLNIFVWKCSKIAAQKKIFFFADLTLQTLVKTKLPK